MSKELLKKIDELEKEIRIRWQNFDHFDRKKDIEGVELSRNSINEFKEQLEATKKALNDYNLAKEKGMSSTEMKNLIRVIEYHKLPILEVDSIRNIAAKRIISVKLDNIFFHAANSEKKLYEHIMEWITENYLKETVKQ